MPKKVLVAGGAGFIGSHLCELLMEKGDHVTVLDNVITGQRKNIEHLFTRGLVWLDVDLCQPHFLNLEYDHIYNLASPASPVDFDKMPCFILETASIGHRNLLEHACQSGSRVLFASTSEAYGDPLVHPQPESYYGNVNPVGPRSCYDEAKRFGEALTMAYHREKKLETRIARIFNTYGPRMRPDDGRIIPNFCMQAIKGEPMTIHGKGEQSRSYCYVTDLADGLYKLMNSNEIYPVNLGNTQELTVKEVAQIINDAAGGRSKFQTEPGRPDDPQKRQPDLTRAKTILGWEPKVSFRDGLTKTLEYFRTQN